MRNIVLNLQENNLTHWPRRQQSRKTDPHRKRNRYLDFACVGYVFLFDGITISRGSPSCTWWYWRETLICWAVFQQPASGKGYFFLVGNALVPRLFLFCFWKPFLFSSFSAPFFSFVFRLSGANCLTGPVKSMLQWVPFFKRYCTRMLAGHPVALCAPEMCF